MGLDGAERIAEYAPKTGAVRLLRLTEKQYNNIGASFNEGGAEGIKGNN